MLLKLTVKNNAGGRVISWLGRGEWFDKGEERDIDFTLLPNILETMIHCRLDTMNAEIQSKDVSVCVSTDLDVRKIKDIVIKSPEAKPVVVPVAPPVKVEEKLVEPGKDKAKADRQGMFSQGTMEEYFPKAKQFMNDKDAKEATDILSPADIPIVEMFADKPGKDVPALPKAEPIFQVKDTPPPVKVVEMKPARRGRPPKIK